MVEARIVPVGWIVAIFALLAATAVMRIVFGVTAVAGRRRIQIGGVGVTIKACRLDVLADQRVVGCIVIEARFGPLGGLMAILAAVGECGPVNIIVFVTIIAGAGRFPVQKIDTVTVGTLKLCVRTNQFEVRELVIESRLVQAHDVCVTAQVIGMTNRALYILGLRIPAVETRECGEVHGDVFMTIKAESPLRGLIEILVAGGTIGFQLGMIRRQLPRHDQSLDLGFTDTRKENG